LLINYERSDLTFTKTDSVEGGNYCELHENLTRILEKVWPYFLACVNSEFELHTEDKFNSKLLWEYLNPDSDLENISPTSICSMWRDGSLQLFTSFYSIALAQAKQEKSFAELFDKTRQMYEESPFRVARAGSDSVLDKRLIEGIETGLIFLLWAASAPVTQLLKTDTDSRPSIDTSPEKIDAYANNFYGMISKLATRSLMSFGIIGNPQNLSLQWNGNTLDLRDDWFEDITLSADSLSAEIPRSELQAARKGCPFHKARNNAEEDGVAQNLLTMELELLIRQLAQETLYPVIQKNISLNKEEKNRYFFINSQASSLLPPKKGNVILTPATVLTGNASAGKTTTVTILSKEATIIDEMIPDIIGNTLEKGFTSQDAIRFVVPIIETTASRHIQKLITLQEEIKNKDIHAPILPIICDRGIGDYLGMLQLVLLSTQPNFIRSLMRKILKDDRYINTNQCSDWRAERKEIKRLIQTLKMWGQSIRYQKVLMLEDLPPYVTSSGRPQNELIRSLLRWSIKSSWKKLGVIPTPIAAAFGQPEERAEQVLHLANESFQ
jgi:hypothetical protein